MQDYERDIRKLARKIKAARKRLDNIYSLPRNGLIPAVSLSHLLGKPIIFDVRKVILRLKHEAIFKSRESFWETGIPNAVIF